MKLRLALLVCTVSFAAHAVPNVTSVTGTVADDQVVVISGSLFGENALEQEWLGGASGFIDSLPDGARFDEQNRPGWTLLQPSTATYPHISTELAWSRGKSIAFDVRGTAEYKQSLFYDTGSTGYSELYTNALIRLDHDDLLSGSHLQWKMMRWTHTETVVDGDGSILSNWPGSMSYYSTYSDSGQTTFWFDSPGAESLPGKGAWYRYECWVHPGASYFRVRVTNPTTGEVVADNERTDMPHDASTPHRYWVLQNYFGNASDGGYSQPDNGNAVAFWDDVYASKSQARVEVCESPTWSACVNRELQPASAWANDSISVRLNQGALGTLSHAFLYVTDADGAVNEQGFELAAGGEPSTGGAGGTGAGGTGGAIGADAGNADAGAGTSSGGASSNASDSGDDGGCSVGQKPEQSRGFGSFGLVLLAFAMAFAAR